MHYVPYILAVWLVGLGIYEFATNNPLLTIGVVFAYFFVPVALAIAGGFICSLLADIEVTDKEIDDYLRGKK